MENLILNLLLFMKNYYLKHKWKIYNKSKRSDILWKNNYALISASYSLITPRQVETLRRFISRRLNKKLKKKMNKRFSMNRAMFKKSKNARMGKGIGKFSRWYGTLKPGTILFEFSMYINFTKKHNDDFSSISAKLPFNFKLLSRSLRFKL